MEGNLMDQTFSKICKKLQNFDKQLNDKFIQLNTNFDRFRFIWSLGFVHAELDAMFDSASSRRRGEYFEPKDTSKAFEFRKLGNEHFVAKRFEEALLNYNQSIRYAPRVLAVIDDTATDENASQVDNDLALSYGNRSAVYFHMNEHRLSLSDIDRAFKFGYPKHLRHKLVERKLNCLLRLEWFNEALSYLNSECDPNLRSDLKERIKDARKILVILTKLKFLSD